jgi:hypothetical protein
MIRFYLKLYKSKGVVNGFEYPRNSGDPAPVIETYDITNFVVNDDDIIINKRVEYDSLDSIATDEIDLTIIKNSFTEGLLFNDYFKSLHIEGLYKLYFAGFIDNNRMVNYNEETLEIKANGVLAFWFDLLNFVSVPYNIPSGGNFDYNLNYFLSTILATTSEFSLRNFLDYNAPYSFWQIKLPPFQNTDFHNWNYYFLAYISNQWFRGNAKYKYMAKDLLLEVLKHYLAMIYVHSSRNLVIQSKIYLVRPYDLPPPLANIPRVTDYALDDIVWEAEYSVYDGVLFNLIDRDGNGWWALYPKNAELFTDTPPESDYTYVIRKVSISREGFWEGDYLDLRLKTLTDSGVQFTHSPLLFLDYPRTIALPYANKKFIDLYLYYVPKNEFSGYDSSKDTRFGIYEKLLNKKTSILKTTLTGLDYNIGDFFEFNNKIFILYEMKLNLTQNITEVAMREIK